jgi:2-polyprenyl-6-methoxyphenol hydroxylase-like FAD-dependent oxidoreductase
MNLNLNENLTILIVGAGLGGLALAQGLTKAGFNVSVFERDQSPSSRMQGYRISIRSMGLNALSALLPSDRLSQLTAAKIADVGDGFTFANEKMEPLLKIPQGQDAAVQFLRSELRSVLQEGINVVWNKQLMMLEEKDDQVIVYFADGSHAKGDFVVGCDGAGSTIRELLPSVYKEKLGALPKIIDHPHAILGGQIDRTPEWDELLPLNQSGLVRFLGENLYMGVCFSERADRSPTVFWAIKEEVTDPNAPWYQYNQSLECRKCLLEHCKQLINNETWHENLQKLVHETQPEAMMTPWLLRTTRFSDLEQFPMVPSGRITLLGDAAHTMPPDLGLGGNNVLEDARLLFSLLTVAPRPVDWRKLTAEFEKKMFRRARQAVEESENTATMHNGLRAKLTQ